MQENNLSTSIEVGTLTTKRTFEKPKPRYSKKDRNPIYIMVLDKVDGVTDVTEIVHTAQIVMDKVQ